MAQLVRIVLAPFSPYTVELAQRLDPKHQLDAAIAGDRNRGRESGMRPRLRNPSSRSATRVSASPFTRRRCSNSRVKNMLVSGCSTDTSRSCRIQ